MAGWCDNFACDLDKKYHDEEWGFPLHDDAGLFEALTLECLQCGLSWRTIITKREIFRRAFDGFDFEKVADFDEKKISEILTIPGMIRSERKIRAVINNAGIFRNIRGEFGTFDRYVWNFSDGKTLFYKSHADGNFPATNDLAKTVAADMKRRGFKFVGAVNVYAFLQSIGIICDHCADCECREKILKNFPSVVAEG